MHRTLDAVKFSRMLRNGELKDPEKASVIPCEIWEASYKFDAERVLLLATSELVEGATDEDRLHVMQDFIAQVSTDGFMRGLFIGYLAFGHVEAADTSLDVIEKLSDIYYALLLASILQNFGFDVLEAYLAIGDEDEEDDNAD